MAHQLILETTFLIDLERAQRRGGGPALEFLRGNSGASLYTTFTVAGELAAGFGTAGKRDWESLLAPFHVLPSTPEVCWIYGTLYQNLRRAGQTIGTNDLWIAATALHAQMPVVTRNTAHFERVHGLSVVGYA